MVVITGATGQLGRLVIDALLQSGVAPETVVAAVRSPEKAKDLRAKGVQVRLADYAKPETLPEAFAGAEKVLLISSSVLGPERVQQHKAAIDAAKAAGVTLLAYTSILNADRGTSLLADDHNATEAYLRSSGVPFALLRNGWYLENHTASLPAALQHGAVLGAAKGGQFAAAPRRDYATAAAVVLSSPGHENTTYELGGDQPYTLEEYAAEIASQSGKPVAYRNLRTEEYAAALAGFGLPEPVAKAVANADEAASRGELTTERRDLHKLLGRAPGGMPEAVRATLAS